MTDEERNARLEGMTHDKWMSLPQSEREQLRDNGGLNPQLIGLEGWRVEVVTVYGETRRFIVGKSTGWKPCHLEVSRRNAFGGYAAEREYKSVTRIYRAR